MSQGRSRGKASKGVVEFRPLCNQSPSSGRAGCMC